MVGEVIIKEGLPEDAAKRIKYTEIIGAETDNLSFGKEGFPITEEAEAEFIKSVHDDPHSVSYFAWRDGNIIGDASLSGLPRRMGHRAELGLTVVKAEWNCGIGSQLLRKAIEYAEANGIEIINLEVRSDNLRAIHVYNKFGFIKNGSSPAYFKINGEYVDFDLMYLDLRKKKVQNTWKDLYQAAKTVQNGREISERVYAGGVAAAIEAVSGNIYTGVCVDTSCTLGICAERNAMFSMITNGESEIRRVLAIMPDGKTGAPCGACREFMTQLMPDHYQNVEIMLDYEKGRIATLGELTPEWWI